MISCTGNCKVSEEGGGSGVPGTETDYPVVCGEDHDGAGKRCEREEAAKKLLIVSSHSPELLNAR